MTKSKKENVQKYITDFKKILKITIRMYKYSLNRAKKNTLGFFISIVAVSLLPYLLNWLWTQSLDALILINEGTEKVYYLFVAYIIVFALEKLSWVLTDYFERSNYYLINRHFTYDLAKKYSELDIEYYENPKFNDLLQKVKESFGWQANEFLNRTFWMVRNLISIVAAVLILISFSPLMIIVIVVISIPELINKMKYGRMGWAMWDAEATTKREYYDTLGLLNKESSLFEIKVYNTRQYLLDKLKSLYDSFISKQEKIEKKGIISSGLISIIIPIGYGIIGFMLIRSVATGEITVGLFAFYISTVFSFSNAFSNFLRNLSYYYRDGLYVIDIFKVLDLEKKLISGNEIITNTTPPTIEFRNVWFKYPETKRYIFKDLSFKIEPGENIAIVGKNGAGKTTFVKLLCRFYDVTKGEILIDNVNIKDIQIDSLYRKLSLLTQDFVRYHFDAKTNIGLGNIQQMKNKDKIIEAAKKGGAHEFISKEFEHDYNQILSKKYATGLEPSVGQWQKIALSRAFFKDSPILILDEPTSAIDPKAEAEIFDNIFSQEESNKINDKTIVIISHRFSTVRNADKIIVMAEGRIVEQGTHEELMELEGIYKEAFDLQKRGYQ